MPQNDPQSQSSLGKRTAADRGYTAEQPATRVATSQHIEHVLDDHVFMQLEMFFLSDEVRSRIEQIWSLIAVLLEIPIDHWFDHIETILQVNDDTVREVILSRLVAKMQSPENLNRLIVRLQHSNEGRRYLSIMLTVISKHLCFRVEECSALKALLKENKPLLVIVGRYLLFSRAHSWLRHRQAFSFLSDDDYLFLVKDVVQKENQSQHGLMAFINACAPNFDLQITQADHSISTISILDYVFQGIFCKVLRNVDLRRCALAILFRSKLEFREYFPLLRRLYLTLDGLFNDILYAIPNVYEQRTCVVEKMIEVCGDDLEFILKLSKYFSIEDILASVRERTALSSYSVSTSVAQVDPISPRVDAMDVYKEAQLVDYLTEWRRRGFSETIRRSLLNCIRQYGSYIAVMRVVINTYKKSSLIRKAVLLIGETLSVENPLKEILVLLFKTAESREQFFQFVFHAFSEVTDFPVVQEALVNAIQADADIIEGKKLDAFLSAFNRRAIINCRMVQVVAIAKRHFLSDTHSALHCIALDQVCSMPTLTAYLATVDESDREAAFFRFLIRYCDRGLTACLAKLADAGWSAEMLAQHFSKALYEIKAEDGAFIALRFALHSDWQAARPADESLAAQIFIRFIKTMDEQNLSRDFLNDQRYFKQPKGFWAWCLDLCHRAGILIDEREAASDAPPSTSPKSSDSSVSLSEGSFFGRRLLSPSRAPSPSSPGATDLPSESIDLRLLDPEYIARMLDPTLTDKVGEPSDGFSFQS